MNSLILAIDFGTTRTKVAYYDSRRQEPRLIELGRDQRTVIPSLFYLPKEGGGEILAGDDAQEMVEVDPEGIVIGLKKELHKHGKIRRGPGRLAVGREQLAGRLFHYVRQRCQEEVFHNGEIAACCLTVPSAFAEPQREAIRLAAREGGFTDITLMDEPVAAAQAWLAFSGQEIADTVIVCDVGGGTTDFALVRRANRQFHTDDRVTPTGLELGGNDVDVSIWEQLLSTQPNETHLLERFSPGFLIKLRRVRERLLLDRQSQIVATLAGQTLQIRREVVEHDVEDFVKRVADETRRYAGRCAAAGVGGVPILLAGGGSRLTGLKAALESLNVGRVCLWNEGEFATVLGAVPVAEKQMPDGVLGRDRGSVKSSIEGHYKEAKGRRDFVRAQTQQPADTEGPTLTDTLSEAQTMIGDGHCQKAFDLVTKAMQEKPNDELLYFWNDCGCTVPDGSYVLGKARELCRHRHNDLWSSCCLALALSGLGRLEEAEQAVRPFLQGESSSGFALLFVEWALTTDESKRGRLLEKLQVLRPDDAALKALSCFAAPDKMLFHLNEAVQSEPYSLSTLFLRAFFYITGGIGTEQDFQSDLIRMERISPRNFFTLVIKGAFLADRGDFSSAKPVLSMAIEDQRAAGNREITSSLLVKRALCHQNLGTPEAARADVEQSIRLNPTNLDALTLRGMWLRGEEKYQEALSDLNTVLAQNAENALCLVERGWCFLSLNQFAEAAADFENAWRADANNQAARQGAAFSQVLIAVATRNTPLPNVYIWPNVPQDKLNSALQTYLGGMPQDAVVLLLYDDTFWGGAKDGFCLTEDTIYWHNQTDTPGRKRYQDISEISSSWGLKVDSQSLDCHFGDQEGLAAVILSLVELYRRHST